VQVLHSALYNFVTSNDQREKVHGVHVYVMCFECNLLSRKGNKFRASVIAS
jgi:hypothetical protein